MEEFKPNSNVLKKQDPPNKETTNNQPSNVIIRPNSESKNAFRHFFAEDLKTVGGHVVESVVVPTLQKLLSDAVKSSIDWIIYGSKGGNRINISGPSSVSYTNYYQRNSIQPNFCGQQKDNFGAQVTGNPIQSKSGVYSVNDVIFNDRSEAENVLMRMNEAIARYQMVSVSEFYDLINRADCSSFTDNKYGWYDLRATQIVRDGPGYRIQFPKVQPLE